MSGPAIRQAVILVGGKGARLGAITRTVPKPMLPIADRPFLDYLLEMLARHGYEDILLLAGYLGEAVEEAYGGRRIGEAAVRVLREPVPLGTAGALTVARDALDPRFLMMNGDAFFDVNLRALEQASHQSGAMATLALRSVPDAARYGRVIEEQGRVAAFLEKDAKSPGPGIINGGYALRREILDLILNLPCSLEKDVFPALVERGEIRGPRFDGYFLDIGLPETLEQGRRELPKVRLRPAGVFDRDALVHFAEGDSSPPEAFQWTKGAVEAIRALNDRGYYVLVTNHEADEARRLNAAMQERLAPEGAHVDRFAPGDGTDTAKGSPISASSSRTWTSGRWSASDPSTSASPAEISKPRVAPESQAVSLTAAILRASSIRSWRNPIEAEQGRKNGAARPSQLVRCWRMGFVASRGRASKCVAGS
jgi:D-glycero-D-manno-heptose 1,7-bisphosphate phosphatase